MMRSAPPGRRGVHLVKIGLQLALLAAACSPAPPEPAEPPLDPAVVESWVRPEPSPVFWSVWADARDFLGEERWGALDTSWMEERARADLAEVTARSDYGDEFLLSGLWRLGLLREEVLGALERREAEAVWPLDPGDVRSVWAGRCPGKTCGSPPRRSRPGRSGSTTGAHRRSFARRPGS